MCLRTRDASIVLVEAIEGTWGCAWGSEDARVFYLLSCDTFFPVWKMFSRPGCPFRWGTVYSVMFLKFIEIDFQKMM